MSSLMQRLHRFIYDDICEEVENIMVTVRFTYLSVYTRCLENDVDSDFL